jgi:anti-sigma B factor antagonist
MSRDVEQNGAHGDVPGHAWYQVEQVGGSAVVRAGGELDSRTVHGFDEAVTEAASLATHVVIDLSQVTFVDSSGLGALIVARKAARERGGSVSLVSPPAVVRRLLGSTQLHDVFAIHDSMAEAIKAPTEP